MSFIVPEHKRKVHSGQRFTRLTVAGIPFYGPKWGNSSQRLQTVVCECDCGKPVLANAYDLRSKTVQSCGCIAGLKVTTHGETNTRLYRTWRGMKARCLNANDKDYHRYGGRGIVICNEWIESFERFRDWSLASGYRDDLTIDRIDVNGNYEPENCRWADYRQQANNRRNTFLVTAFGETKTAEEWGDDPHSVVPGAQIRARVRLGWEPERAITEPSRAQLFRIMPADAFGETKSLIEWSRDVRCVVSYRAMRERVQHGWDLEAAMTLPLIEGKGRSHKKKGGSDGC